jgi:N-carbamoyl-D-amino-acid hydrolase
VVAWPGSRVILVASKQEVLLSRIITVAAAQLGPIQKAEPRSVAVARMVRLMERAHKRGVQLVVFPELALTTFFPRHFHQDVREADSWFETAMPSNETAPLFEAARRFGIGSTSATPN